jgi:hypothetical protein
MKTPSLSLLNSICFKSPAQKCLYSASLLRSALISAPAITLSAATPLVPAKPAVVGHSAYPAFAGQRAILANPSNPLIPANTLYWGQPEFKAGEAVPALPPKPATAEVLSTNATPEIPAKAAVVIPTVSAIKGWEESIDIASPNPTLVQITAYLPYNLNAGLIGAPSTVGEITPTNLVVSDWIDTKAFLTPESIASEPPTLEQYFYKYSQLFLSSNPESGSISKTTKMINNVHTQLKKIILNIPTVGYDINSDSLQLEKL